MKSLAVAAVLAALLIAGADARAPVHGAKAAVAAKKRPCHRVRVRGRIRCPPKCRSVRVHGHLRCRRPKKRAPVVTPTPFATPTTTPEQPTPPAPAESATPTPTPTATPYPRRVGVDEKEWSVYPSRNVLGAGDIEFNVTNFGMDPHDFSIRDDGGAKRASVPLDPGESKTLNVTLPAGHYVLYCSLYDHEAQGMSAAIEVR